MPGELPYVAGVRSNLIEEQIQQNQLPPSANAIIIFGTATQGPLYTPTRITPATAESTFGASVNDPYEKFNLMKGFHEINGTFPRADIIGVRIGNAKKAKLNLYEHQVTSGEYKPQATDTISVSLESLQEGNDGNGVTTDVYGDEQGIPTRMIIGLPTGTSVEFDLANTHKVPSALATAINADDEVSEYVKATPNVLSTSGTVSIIDSPAISGQIETVYSLEQNNILDITAAYIQGSYDDENSVAAGRSSATLAKTPIKDESDLTETIDAFFSIIRNEEVIKTTPAEVGETEIYLDAKDHPKFDNTYPNSIRSLVVKKKSGSTGITTTLTVTTDYSLNVAQAKITLTTPLAVGDTIYADYQFRTSFIEANVRSALDIGNPYSYFVGGDTITFGATQTYPLALLYETKSNFAVPGDISLSDAAAGQIRFAINENTPSTGDAVVIEYVFEPELPAPNQPIGTVLPSGKRQASQLTGGTDGRRITLPEYYNELAKGYISADNTPFRIAVPQGIYYDDVMQGIDFETGLPVETNAGFHTQLSLFLARHSIFVSECIGIMSVRPMTTVNPVRPSLEEREAWYDQLVNVSATDTTRPANVISSVNDFHLVATVGDFIWSIPNVSGGRLYMEGGHNMFAGMKFFHDNLTSIVTRSVPQTVIRGMGYVIKAADRINKINSMRYTLFTEDSDTGQFKPASAPTLAASTSQFRLQYNLDITIEAVNRVRRILKPFIGQPNKNATREAMRHAAKQELQLMSPSKLMAFDINVVTTRTEAINGKVQVDLRLTTAVEIQQINVRTRLELGF